MMIPINSFGGANLKKVVESMVAQKMPNATPAMRKKAVALLLKQAKKAGHMSGKGQVGSGFFDFIKNIISKVGSFLAPAVKVLAPIVKDNKLISRGLQGIANSEGAPDFVKKIAGTAGSIAGNVGYGRRMRGGSRAVLF